MPWVETIGSTGWLTILDHSWMTLETPTLSSYITCTTRTARTSLLDILFLGRIVGHSAKNLLGIALLPTWLCVRAPWIVFIKHDALNQCWVDVGPASWFNVPFHMTRDIEPMLFYCSASVEDDGLTLIYHWSMPFVYWDGPNAASILCHLKTRIRSLFLNVMTTGFWLV